MSSRRGRKPSIGRYFSPLPAAQSSRSVPAQPSAKLFAITKLPASVSISPKPPPKLDIAAPSNLSVAIPPSDWSGPAGPPSGKTTRHQSPVTPAAPQCPERLRGSRQDCGSDEARRDDSQLGTDASTADQSFANTEPRLAVAVEKCPDSLSMQPDFNVEVVVNDNNVPVEEMPPVPADTDDGQCWGSEVLTIEVNVDEPILEPDTIVCKGANSRKDVVDLSDSPLRPTKRARASLPPPAKRLHSFFTAKPSIAKRVEKDVVVNPLAERAIAQSRERAVERAAKRKRPRTVLVDPWESSDFATVHVNAPTPPECRPNTESVHEIRWKGPRACELLSDSSDPFWAPTFKESSAVGSGSKCLPGASAERVTSSTLWSDDAREEGINGVDAINKETVDNLTMWLKPFYAKRKKAEEECEDSESSGSDSDEDSEDGDDVYRYRREDCSDGESCDEFGAENVCLITGEVGCGKSTIVRQAAARLQLTILEINAMKVRSGKRVKDTVREALATHRITSGKRAESSHTTQNDGYNTLIVFEEVDHLAEDDRGFWTAISELSAVAGARRPMILTANRVTPEMSEVFGYLRCETAGEVGRLIGRQDPPELGDPLLCRFKRIVVHQPSAKEVYNVLRAVSRVKGVSMDKVNKRVLTAMFAEGDCRGAINALQFWSLPGLGCVASDGITWPEIREDESFTEAAALFRSLQNVDTKLRIHGDSAKTLSSWADTLDVFSEADVICLDSAFEASAMACVSNSGMESTGPNVDDAQATSYYYSLAYLRNISSSGQQVPETLPRDPASSRAGHDADMRGNIRRMTCLEIASRCSGNTEGSRCSRATRSSTYLKPSSFSRLSDDALRALNADRLRIPKNV